MLLYVSPRKDPDRLTDSPSESDVREALWVLGEKQSCIALNRSKEEFLAATRESLDSADAGRRYRAAVGDLGPARFFALVEAIMLSYLNGASDWKTGVSWIDVTERGS